MRNLARVCLPTAALILLSAGITNAQPLASGVKIGLNISSLPNAGSILDPVVKQSSVETSSKAGATLGAFLIVPIMGQFSFQPELMFSAKGVKLTEAANKGTVTASLRYLEFPMLLRYSTDVGHHTAYFLVGPTFGVKASTSAHLEGPNQTVELDIDNAVRSFDGGMAFAGGVHFSRYLFEVRYTQGLSDVGNDSVSHPDSVRNRVFAVLAGIRFN